MNTCLHLGIQGQPYNIWKADSNTRRYRNELLRYFQLLRMIPKGISQILDIGCGTGYMSVLLAKAGMKVIALDIRKENLACFEAMAKTYKIRQVHGDLFQMHFPPVDALLCQEVLEHIEDVEKALHKMKEFLRPGAWALFCVPYQENLDAKQVQCPQCGQWIHKNGHLHSFTESTFSALLKSTGYRIQRVQKIVNKRTVKWTTQFQISIHRGILWFDQIVNACFPHKSAYLAVLTQKPK